MTLPASHIDTNEFKGRCPICSAALLEDGQDKAFVICTEFPHYRIEKTVFEKAWDEFEVSIQTVGGNKSQVEIVIKGEHLNALMSGLITSNKAVGGPTTYTADGKIK
jgi:hypothetical protein